MAGATYVLDKTYKETDAAGVGAFLVVVPGTNDGECKLPTAANQQALGITQEAQPNQGENVTVRVYGISRAIAAGAIAPGDPVEAAGASGKVQKVTPSAAGATIHHVIGFAESTAAADGDHIFVRLSQSLVNGA
jgi:hypothetical protein